MDRYPLIGNAVLLDRRIDLDVLNELGNHALRNSGSVGVSAHRFQEGVHIHSLIFQLFRLQPQRLDPPGVLALFLLISLGHFGKPGIIDLARHVVLVKPLKEHIQLPIPGQQPIQLPLLAYPVIFRYLGGAAHHRLDKVVFVFVSEAGQTVYLVKHDLFQEVQPDIVGRRAFTEPGIVVVAAKELDVVVALVEVESQIAAALRAFQIAGEHAGLLGDLGPLAAGAFGEGLHLFPGGTVNDGLMDIEENGPVFLRVFNAAFDLIGFGVTFEVDHIAAVFLQGEDFLDGGMVPLGRLQCTFRTALTDPFAGSIGRGVQSFHPLQRSGNGWPAGKHPSFLVGIYENATFSLIEIALFAARWVGYFRISVLVDNHFEFTYN